MKGPLQFTAALLIGFGLGFTLVSTTSDRPRATVRQPGTPIESTASPMAEDAHPATTPLESDSSEARIKAVFANGGKASPFARDHAAFAALQKLTAADFLKAAEDLPKLFAGEERDALSTRKRDLGEAWVDRWLEVDRENALRILAGPKGLESIRKSEKSRLSFFVMKLSGAESGMFQSLARHDPDWTLQYLAGCTPSSDLDVGYYRLVEEVVKTDVVKGKSLFLSDFTGHESPGCASGLCSRTSCSGRDSSI